MAGLVRQSLISRWGGECVTLDRASRPSGELNQSGEVIGWTHPNEDIAKDDEGNDLLISGGDDQLPLRTLVLKDSRNHEAAEQRRRSDSEAPSYREQSKNIRATQGCYTRIVNGI